MDEGEGDSDENESIDEILLSSSELRPGPSKGKRFMDGMRNIVFRTTVSQQKITNKAILLTHAQKKKAKHASWEQIRPAKGFPQVPEVILSYSEHVTAVILRGQINLYNVFIIIKSYHYVLINLISY